MFTFPNAIIDQNTGHIIVQTPAPPYAYLMFDGSFTDVARYEDFFKAFTDTQAMHSVRAVAGTGGGAVAALMCALKIDGIKRQTFLQHPLFKPTDESGWLAGLGSSWAATFREQNTLEYLESLLHDLTGEVTFTLQDLATSDTGIHLYLGVGDSIISHETHPEWRVVDAVSRAISQPASSLSPFYHIFNENRFLPHGFGFNELAQNPAVFHVPLDATLVWLKQHYEEAFAIKTYPSRVAWLDDLTLDAFASLLRAYESLTPVPQAYLQALKAYFAWRCEGGADPVSSRPDIRLPHVNCPPVVVGGEWNAVVKQQLTTRLKTLNLEIKRMQQSLREVIQQIPIITVVDVLHNDLWFHVFERYAGYKTSIRLLLDEKLELQLLLGLKTSLRAHPQRYESTPQLDIQQKLNEIHANFSTSAAYQAIFAAGYPEVMITRSPHYVGMEMKFDYRQPAHLKQIVMAVALYLKDREPSSLPAWMPMYQLVFGEKAELPANLASMFEMLALHKPRKQLIAAVHVELLLNEYARRQTPASPSYVNLDEVFSATVTAKVNPDTSEVEMKHIIGRLGLFDAPDLPPIAPSTWMPARRI